MVDDYGNGQLRRWGPIAAIVAVVAVIAAVVLLGGGDEAMLGPREDEEEPPADAGSGAGYELEETEASDPDDLGVRRVVVDGVEYVCIVTDADYDQGRSIWCDRTSPGVPGGSR